MNFEYRKAELSDLNSIMQIYGEAQSFMESYGNPQWERGFPSEADVRGGIFGGIIYVVTVEEEITGVFSVVFYDHDYDTINGKWLSSDKYIAVHRVAVSDKFRRKGAAKFIIKSADELAKQSGAKSVRFDTHERNIPMLTLLSTNGFTRCGTILIFRDDTQRIAFEKLI